MPPWGNVLKDEQVGGVLDYVLADLHQGARQGTEAAQAAGEESGGHRARNPSRTASRFSWSAAPAATGARPTARGRTRSTSCRTRATCGTVVRRERRRTGGCSNRSFTACRARPCHRGSITADAAGRGRHRQLHSQSESRKPGSQTVCQKVAQSRRRRRVGPPHPHRHDGEVVSGERHQLLLHRRNRRPDHRGQVRAGRNCWARCPIFPTAACARCMSTACCSAGCWPPTWGSAYYIVPRLCGVKLWSEKLGVATAVLWNVIILGAVVALLGGYNHGFEYAELPLPLAILVVIAWVMFGINIFATIGTRKYQQMYVSIWYIMGTILWTAFVYITGNFAVDFTTGVNQANLNWMYMHNAVGLIFTPIGLGVAYYFIPQSVQHAAVQPPALHDRLLVAGLRLRVDGRAPHDPRADFAVAADHRHHVLGDAADPGVGGGLQLLRHHEGPVAAVARERAAEVPDVGRGVLPADLLPGPHAQPAQRQRHRLEDRLDSGPRAHGAAGRFSFFAIAGTYYVVPRCGRPSCTPTRWPTGASGS